MTVGGGETVRAFVPRPLPPVPEVNPREMHAKLLASGRGAAMMPGEFRRSQNWIGGVRHCECTSRSSNVQSGT